MCDRILFTLNGSRKVPFTPATIALTVALLNVFGWCPVRISDGTRNIVTHFYNPYGKKAG